LIIEVRFFVDAEVLKPVTFGILPCFFAFFVVIARDMLTLHDKIKPGVVEALAKRFSSNDRGRTACETPVVVLLSLSESLNVLLSRP